MIVKLRPQGLQTFDEIQAFLDGSQPIDFEVTTREEAYAFAERSLRVFRYASCSRAHKGLLRRYLAKITGLSRAQVTRLIAQHRDAGRIRDRRGPPARPFPRRYTDADVRALAEIDRLHDQLSGGATRKLCERAYHRFDDTRYERLAGISNGHLYNLRASTVYRRARRQFEKTRPTPVSIAERRRPRPDGRPGYLRVDTVHQGDLDGVKGLYHINLVDEVTQFQFIGAVPVISERCLVPLLETLINRSPFTIRGFHADNGSEFINRKVRKLLTKLHVTEFTKSRPRHSQDNGLAESKNASTVRKHLGHAHIPQHFADVVDGFHQDVLCPYLNYHRPCHFPSEVIDGKGRVTKRYRFEDMMTPYEKLKSLPDAASYLRPGVTFEALDAQAYRISDNQAAQRVNDARAEMFHAINDPQSSIA